jgi:hypothetical protein
MKPRLHNRLISATLSFAFLVSSVGLPAVVLACPAMQKCSVESSCCEVQTNRQTADLSTFASYACCSRTIVASSLRFESTEAKSTNLIHKEKTGLSNPSEAVVSETPTQNPSLILPVVADFSPPGSSLQLSLPLRI